MSSRLPYNARQNGSPDRAAIHLRRPPSPLPMATVTPLGPPLDTPLGTTAECRHTVGLDAVQGTLALDLGGSAGMPPTPELRVVDGDGRALDDLNLWAARFAQAVVEVLGGDRPVTQLVRWTSARVYTDLSRRVRILGLTSAVDQRLSTVRPQVRSVHVFKPTAGCAEVSVHVRHGKRSRALAARLELERGRWQCTALQLG